MKHYYGSIKCPYCQSAHYVFAGQTSSSPTPDTPIRRCQKCHRTFLCLDFGEPALLRYTSPTRLIQEPKIGKFVIVGIVFLALGLLLNGSSPVYTIYSFFAIGAILIVSAIIMKLRIERIKERKEKAREAETKRIEEYLSGPTISEMDKQSLLRLSNPDYIRYLEMVGVSVPNWFKDRIDYNKYLCEVSDAQFVDRIKKLDYPITQDFVFSLKKNDYSVQADDNTIPASAVLPIQTENAGVVECPICGESQRSGVRECWRCGAQFYYN